LPAIPAELLGQPLRQTVLQRLLDDEAIDEDRVAKLLSGQQSDYGRCRNRARGVRKAELADAETPPLSEGAPGQVDPEASRAARAAWARLITKVYEADPSVCPH